MPFDILMIWINPQGHNADACYAYLHFIFKKQFSKFHTFNKRWCKYFDIRM